MTPKPTPKKRKRTPPYKSQSQPTDVSGAVEEAMGEFESLRDEMGEWRDNMSGSNMDHLDKYQEVESAADALDGFADNSPEIPDALAGLAVMATIMVPSRKGRGTSRAMRCSNAISLIEAACGTLDEFISDAEGKLTDMDTKIEDLRGEAEEASSAEPPDEDAAADANTAADALQTEHDELEEAKDAAETLKQELEEITSEAEGVEFPGMY